MLTYIII